MKNFKRYVNTLYKPSFIMLCIGLGIFSLSMLILASSLRADILMGESDVIYRYPQMLEKILFPLYILLAVTFVVDLNERKSRG